MTGIPEGGIINRSQFEGWLLGLPDELVAQFQGVIATRAALRALPFVRRESFIEIKRRHKPLEVVIGDPTGEFDFTDSAQISNRQIQSAAADAALAAESDFDAGTAAAAAARATIAAKLSGLAADAVNSAAMSAYFAEAADVAAYATNAAASFWKALTEDAQALEQLEDALALRNAKLWLNGAPERWDLDNRKFQNYLSAVGEDGALDQNEWMVWIDWLNSITEGGNSFGLPEGIADNLDQRIALGDGREGFWEREPAQVNAEIAGWVAEARRTASPRVFISYNSADAASAKEVGDAIDSFGFQSFAQYKDMPPGSNFIAEMQDGLAAMGKFSPLYSPDYMASDICQAEWNAAYNMDRLGKRRLIIGFLLKPTTLLPLQKQVVHVPLYGLTKEKARAAIFEALTGNGEKADLAQSRKDAADNASPEPFIDADGKIGVSPDAEVESAFIDDELADLPELCAGCLQNSQWRCRVKTRPSCCRRVSLITGPSFCSMALRRASPTSSAALKSSNRKFATQSSLRRHGIVQASPSRWNSFWT